MMITPSRELGLASNFAELSDGCPDFSHLHGDFRPADLALGTSYIIA